MEASNAVVIEESSARVPVEPSPNLHLRDDSARRIAQATAPTCSKFIVANDLLRAQLHDWIDRTNLGYP